MAETRDRIIAATNELFRRKGYNDTSLKEISAASGATIGSIYHFFPGGKEALGVAVIETTGQIYRELFEAIAAQASDPVQAYVDFFNGGAAILESTDYIDPCPIGTVAREVANTSEPLRMAAASIFESWVDAATAHLQGAGIPADDAAQLAATFVAITEGMFVLSRTQRSTAPVHSASIVVTQLVQQALAAIPAGDQRRPI